MDLEREYLQQRTELIEANSQAFRELQRQEFIIASYIPEEYLVSQGPKLLDQRISLFRN